MPFISEEIWHLIAERGERESLVVASWPESGKADKKLLADFEEASELIKELRTIRKEKNIAFKNQINLIVKGKGGERQFDPLVSKLVNLEQISFTSEKPANAQSIVIGSTEYYVPMEGAVDAEAESKKLQAELDYTKGFLNSVSKKLSNEKFVNNAPENVVAIERKKQAEAEDRIAVLEEQLQSLAN